MSIAQLDRTVIKLTGVRVADWLDGLITNSLDPDTDALTFAALLTPQGKIIADFFVSPTNDGLFLDTPVKFGDGLAKRLKMYRLRAKIDIEISDFKVFAEWDELNAEGKLDPRDPRLGRRLIADDWNVTASQADYNSHRLSLGIPDSQWDFETATTFPANANMDILHGVDFKKGCFVGQEVVSRMYRKTDIRKRMCGFTFDDPLEGTTIKTGDRTVGDILHMHEGQGIAMMRLDRLSDATEPPMVDQFPVNIRPVPLDIRRNHLPSLPQFAALNAAWIEEMHVLEPSDKKMVAHPEIYTANANSVFTIHIDGDVVGACALKQDSEGEWELTKMAVDPKIQGRGLGQVLMEVVEAYAKTVLGLSRIYLLSNTKNAAAIRLYERNGWDILFINEPHPTYARCNIGMEKHL